MGYATYSPLYPHYLGLDPLPHQTTEDDFHNNTLPPGNVYKKVRHTIKVH